MISSTKIAQMVLLRRTKGLPELQIRIYLITSHPEPMVQIQNNFTELSHIMPSTKIAQMVCSAKQKTARVLDKKKEMALNDISS